MDKPQEVIQRNEKDFLKVMYNGNLKIYVEATVEVEYLKTLNENDIAGERAVGQSSQGQPMMVREKVKDVLPRFVQEKARREKILTIIKNLLAKNPEF